MEASTLTAEEEYVRVYLAAAQAAVNEPVIAAALFNRRGLYTQKLMGRAGAIPWLLARAFAKAQAGGLPQNFMLAITPTKVRALKYTAHGRKRDKVEVGEEVAVWDRSAIQVSWQNGPPYQTDVTIESAGEGEKVLCRCGRGTSTERFLQILSDPAAMA
jgi:hypothetical protein